jgi:hypothetical protein
LRTYTIVEEPYRSFVKIVQGTPNVYSNDWSLIF